MHTWSFRSLLLFQIEVTHACMHALYLSIEQRNLSTTCPFSARIQTTYLHGRRTSDSSEHRTDDDSDALLIQLQVQMAQQIVASMEMHIQNEAQSTRK
mmetsp:Transcript_28813/g.44054  ORF Transcript_28813/g.44054 Transcript_28813/m.44054 type:complete len:98 (+) Transcript_28813:45-338(+)